MATPIVVQSDRGTRIENIEMLDLLPPDEGEINQYYGRIGSGKTYAATTDVLRELRRGQIIYANWRIDWKGYDERYSRFKLFLGMIGLKRVYYQYPKSNLHFFTVDRGFTDFIGGLTDCKVYIDEGHIAFDSYEMAKMDIEKRTAVLHTRHFDRTIVIISQRPTAVHVTLRANVNRFFKCERMFKFKLFGHTIVRFRKTEFQDTRENDTPNEEKVRDAKTFEETDEYKFKISEQYYWGRKKVFQAYDTKYRREGLKTSQPNYVGLYKLRWRDTFGYFLGNTSQKRSLIENK